MKSMEQDLFTSLKKYSPHCFKTISCSCFSVIQVSSDKIYWWNICISIRYYRSRRPVSRKLVIIQKCILLCQWYNFCFGRNVFNLNNEGMRISSRALEHHVKKYKVVQHGILSCRCSKTMLNYILYKNDFELIHLIRYLITNKTKSVRTMKSTNTLGGLKG